MEQINNKMMDLLLSYAESAGWRYTLWSEKGTGKQGNNRSVESSIENLKEYAGGLILMDMYVCCFHQEMKTNVLKA